MSVQVSQPADFEFQSFTGHGFCHSPTDLKKMRYAVLITGPAGAGKSTFSRAFINHLHVSKRSAHLVNLDPAASPTSFEVEPVIDIRDLVSLEDVMSELEYGPNGGLVYCFE